MHYCSKFREHLDGHVVSTPDCRLQGPGLEAKFKS